MRARQCEDMVSCDKHRCMCHHDWVSNCKEVNGTDEVRWTERDTMDKTGTDKTGTHHGPALTTHFARRAVIPGRFKTRSPLAGSMSLGVLVRKERTCSMRV